MANYVIAAFAGNLAIAILKLIAGIITKSSTMLGEALHSVADTANQLLMGFGIRRRKRAPDEEHPFGYSKAQFFWALIVSILIFTLAGTLSLFNGVERLLEAHFNSHEDFTVNYIVLILSGVIEFSSFLVALREIRHLKKERQYSNTLEMISNLKNPSLLTVLVEDSLALVGISIALLAMFLTDLTNNSVFDALGAIVIGLILMLGALILARENKSYLIGRSISKSEQLSIKNIVLTSSGVLECKSIKSMVLGPDNFILSIDIDFADNLSVEELENKIDELEFRIIELFPKLTKDKIFIEPN